MLLALKFNSETGNLTDLSFISHAVICLWSCLSEDSDDRQVLLSWSAEHDTCMAECIWMEVISLPLSLSGAVTGYQSFVVETIMAAIKEARWKEVSILTSVHLSSPLSLCLSPSLWFRNPSLIWTMNRAIHLFLPTLVRINFQLS